MSVDTFSLYAGSFLSPSLPLLSLSLSLSRTSLTHRNTLIYSWHAVSFLSFSLTHTVTILALSLTHTTITNRMLIHTNYTHIQKLPKAKEPKSPWCCAPRHPTRLRSLQTRSRDRYVCLLSCMYVCCLNGQTPHTASKLIKIATDLFRMSAVL